MERVQGPHTVRIFELPNPLFARYLNFDSVGRCDLCVHITVESPEEHADQNEKRYDTPDDLERLVMRNVRRDLIRRPAPEAAHESDHQKGDQYKEKDVERCNKPEQVIDVWCERRRLLRENKLVQPVHF